MFNLFSLKNSGGNVSPSEALKALSSPKTILIDVREAGEYNGGHAKGAKSYPLSRLGEKDAETLKKYDAVYVICQSGGRSARATSMLQNSGVKAINVTGGTMGWHAAGLAIER